MAERLSAVGGDKYKNPHVHEMRNKQLTESTPLPPPHPHSKRVQTEYKLFEKKASSRPTVEA